MEKPIWQYDSNEVVVGLKITSKLHKYLTFYLDYYYYIFIMVRGITKKVILILFLACFYFSSILIGNLSTSAASEHIRHQKRGTRSSFTCLLGCSIIVAQIATPPILPSSLPFLGILLVIVLFLFYQTNTSILRSRAPPPLSI